MFTYQLSNNDCAFTSLKNLLATINKDRKFLELISPYSYEYQMSLKDVVDIANQYKVKLNAFKNYSTDSIKGEKHPYLLLIKGISGVNHLVMVKYLNKRISKLYDPDSGKRFVLNKWLEANTVGYYLVIGSYEKYNLNQKKISLIPHKEMFLFLLVESLSLVLCLLGLYFINSSFPLFVSITILIVSLFTTIISKILILKFMKEFDKKYISYTYDENVIKRSLNYKDLQSAKKDLFSFPISFLIYIVSALAVTTILILNEYYSLIAICLSIICAIFNQYVIIPYERKKMRKISVLENDITTSSMSKDEYISKFNESVQPTYLVGSIVSFKTIVLLFAVLAGSFLISAISGNHSLNYVLFYVFSSVFVFEIFNKLLNLLTTRKLYLISSLKIKNMIRKNNDKC